MYRKIFSFLLSPVLIFTQFSTALAAPVAGNASITPLPDFWSGVDPIQIDWNVINMNGLPNQYVLIWSRVQSTPAGFWGSCDQAASAPGLASASGSHFYTNTFFDQQTVEFRITVDDNPCVSASIPATDSAPDASTFIDARPLDGFIANPPSLDFSSFDRLPLTCNTFELWGVVSEEAHIAPKESPFSSPVYSGFKAWNEKITGTFAPPSQIGPTEAVLLWPFTLPSTANGPWSFSVNPTDYAGNQWGESYFRHALSISPEELADCVTFSDISGTDTEIYVRYMADLDLAHGYLDGTFRPDTTLTRAEMASFIEMANGIQSTDEQFGVPPATGSPCDFSDVSIDDWFAGWVWQACADGYMGGIGGGLFDPNNLLTRGQVATVLDNIRLKGTVAGYMNTYNIFQHEWGNHWYRKAAFTDVPIGAFYAHPVENAFGVGVADATSATTFSPDQAILRGEFIKWMYRALSRIQSACIEC